MQYMGEGRGSRGCRSVFEKLLVTLHRAVECFNPTSCKCVHVCGACVCILIRPRKLCSEGNLPTVVEPLITRTPNKGHAIKTSL